MTHVPVESFEQLYRADQDPWSFGTSWYEQRRYDVTVACLPAARYRSAFEPGCAIGELTRRLAARCDSVTALDAAPTAVALARERCRGLPNVEIGVGELPDDWPAGGFDLVMLSELGYYFELDALADLRDRAIGSLEAAGTLMAVHWRGASDVHVLSGDAVHRCLAEGQGLQHLAHYQEDDFLLDVWARR
jgi:SAM-dependent methyltransferase